jgi:hypothetical protein
MLLHVTDNGQAKGDLTRRRAVEIALECVDHLDRTLVREHVGLIDLGLDRMSMADALRGYLTQQIADVLQGGGSPIGQAPSESRLGPWLWRAKEAALGRVHASRGLGRFPRPSPRERYRVLAVPRAPSHLRDVQEVARAAERSRRLTFFSLVFRPDHAHAFERVVLASSYSPVDFRSIRRAEQQIDRIARGAFISRSDRPQVSSAAWARVVEAARAGINAQLTPMLTAAAAITKAIVEIGPRVILVGNPLTIEGAIAIAAARAHGIASASIQHGEIGLGHVEWARTGLDLMAAWGPQPKSTLARLGYPEQRVVVTGAPWADNLRRQPRANKGDGSTRRILIAMSGAGHSVGLAEHEGHVRRLLEASRQLPQHRWVFRLHPKDDPEIYARLMAEVPGSKAEIVDGRGPRPDIRDDLEKSDVLITVTSASAFDAMLARVPVLTLARPKGEVLSAFVLEGATTHAAADEPLAECLTELFAHGESPDASARAERFVANLFGPRDGRAAERIAEALALLAGLKQEQSARAESTA